MKYFIFIVSCALGLSSCSISRHSNFSFVKKKHLSKSTEMAAIGASVIVVKPLVRQAVKDEEESVREQLQPLIKGLRGFKLLSIEENSSERRNEIYPRFEKYLEKKNYKEWVLINSDGTNVSLHAKMRRNNIKKLMIAVNDQGEDLVFIRLKGKLNVGVVSEAVAQITDDQLKPKRKKANT